MVYFLLVLPPMLWALANLVDRKLVDGEGADSSPAALLAIFGLFGLAASTLFAVLVLLNGATIGGGAFLMLAANGGTFTLAMWLYFHALRGEETSRVAPWFQTIPAFGVVGAAVFLGELLAWHQYLAIFLLMSGGFALSVRNGVAKHRLMFLMLIASALLAANDVVFAEFGRDADPSAALLADLVGKTFWGLLCLVNRRTREGFRTGLRSKLRLQALGASATAGADILFDLGKLFIPVAIVQGTACSTPLFVLVGALLLTRYLPHVLQEELGGVAWKRLVGILLVIGGGVILTLST